MIVQFLYPSYNIKLHNLFVENISLDLQIFLDEKMQLSLWEENWAQDLLMDTQNYLPKLISLWSP